jgi:NADH-quinone oxidoreductase subunit C
MRKVNEAVAKLAPARLVAIVCLQEKGHFVLQYYFDRKGEVLKHEARVPLDDPVAESISDAYPSAGIYEREIHDFYGIEFFGNPRLHEKLLLPETWEGKPPMRKDNA